MPPHIAQRLIDGNAPFRTLDLTATVSWDAEALTRIMSRTADVRRRALGPEAVQIYGLPTSVSLGDRDAWGHQTWHVWWSLPALWREELTWPNGQTTVIVVRHDASLAYLPMHETVYTSESKGKSGVGAVFRRDRLADSMQLPTIAERLAEFPLTNPRLPPNEWELTTLGQESHAGRVVQRVRATRRSAPPPMDGARISGYWPWLDEYEYLMDDELLILLRLTGMADGRAVGVISADDLSVDVPLPASLFEFAPPRGTREVYVEQRN